MPDEKPEVYNFSHPDGNASQMSDKQLSGFVDGLVKLSMKKMRDERKKGQAGKSPVAKAAPADPPPERFRK